MCLISNTCVTLTWVNYGLGHHSYDVLEAWLPISMRVCYVLFCSSFALLIRNQLELACACLYSLGVALTNFSVVIAYARIFRLHVSNERFCQVIIAFSTLWCICTVVPQVVNFAQCIPYTASDRYFHASRNVCIDHKVLLLAGGALGTLNDLIVFLWPIKYIQKLKLPLRQRVRVACLFSMGWV